MSTPPRLAGELVQEPRVLRGLQDRTVELVEAWLAKPKREAAMAETGREAGKSPDKVEVLVARCKALHGWLNDLRDLDFYKYLEEIYNISFPLVRLVNLGLVTPIPGECEEWIADMEQARLNYDGRLFERYTYDYHGSTRVAYKLKGSET